MICRCGSLLVTSDSHSSGWLGLAGVLSIARERFAYRPVHDPVPPWLVERLVHQVHMAPGAVAELTGAQAMQTWEAFITAR